MKKITLKLITLAILATPYAHAAQQPMTLSQFFDRQAKINKYISEDQFGKEQEIEQFLTQVEALKGSEPWKQTAKNWAMGARMRLQKSKEARITKGHAEKIAAPTGKLTKGKVVPAQLPAPRRMKRMETPEIKMMKSQLSPHLEFWDALDSYLRTNRQTDFERIIKALDAGADPNAPRDQEVSGTPLCNLTRFKGSQHEFDTRILPLMQLLVSKKADINKPCYPLDESPLFLAMRFSNLPALAFFLNQKNVELIDKRTGETLANRIIYYANSSGEQALKKTIDSLKANGRLNLIDVQDARGVTPLMLATGVDTKETHLKQLQLLLNAGARLQIKDREGMNVLHYAAFNGNLEALWRLMAYIQSYVKELESEGDEEEAWQINSLINEQDHEGNTPLMIAIKRGRYRLAEELTFKFGADPFLKNNKGEDALALYQLRLKEANPDQADIELDRITGLKKYMENYCAAARKAAKAGKQNPSERTGKAFTQEAPLERIYTDIIAECLAAPLPEPENKKEKEAPAKKGGK